MKYLFEFIDNLSTLNLIVLAVFLFTIIWLIIIVFQERKEYLEAKRFYKKGKRIQLNKNISIMNIDDTFFDGDGKRCVSVEEIYSNQKPSKDA